MHWLFITYLGFYSIEEDKIHFGAILHVAYPILSIPCLLLPWRLQEPGHQQTWCWPKKGNVSFLELEELIPSSTIITCSNITKYSHTLTKTDHTPDLKLTQDIDGLVRDCSNSSALAMELLQSCAKPLIYSIPQPYGQAVKSLLWVQSSAIITRSNIVGYYINDYRNWGRKSIRCWID